MKNIGINVQQPNQKCGDRNCPFHGSIKLRGRIFNGTVIRCAMNKTVIVEWPRRFLVRKYERFEKKRSKVKAHNSLCISAKEGDKVRIMETKPISKTKNFVVVEVVK